MNSSATLLDVITNVLIIKLEEESLSKLLKLPLDVEPLLTIFNIGDDLTCVEATSSVELMHFKVVLNTKESTNGFLIFNKYSISHVETILVFKMIEGKREKYKVKISLFMNKKELIK